MFRIFVNQVNFSQCTAKENNVCIFEYMRDHFDKEMLHNTILEMFYYACDSIDYSLMRAEIYKDEVKLFCIEMRTKTDGSIIDAHVYIDDCYYRTMNIAC